MDHPEQSGYHPLEMTVLLRGVNTVMELAFSHSEYPRYVLQELLENGGLEEVVRRIGAHDDTSLVTVRDVVQIMDDVIAQGGGYTPDEPEDEEGFFPRLEQESEPASEFPSPVHHRASSERETLQQVEATLSTWRAGNVGDTEALSAVRNLLISGDILPPNA